MIRILKALLFAAVVLLLGQIPVNSRPIAEHFRLQLGSTLGAAGKEIAGSRLVATVSRHLPGGAGSAKITRGGRTANGDDEEPDLDADTAPGDTVSSSDRESLLRVLQ